MPGITGFVGSLATADAISSATASLMHFATYCAENKAPFENVRVAQVWRRPQDVSGSWYSDTEIGVSVFVNGTIVTPGTQPVIIDARKLQTLYSNGQFNPAHYDGSFIVVIADQRKNQLRIVNDRLGTLPCYYHSRSEGFCFGPEIKAIFSGSGLQPRYSSNGLVTFLTLGYCLADTTLFASVHALEPGSELIVDTSNGRFISKRYWTIEYRPAAEYRSRNNAEDALYEAVIGGHRSTFANPAERYDLLLSGGWDSRGMLAFANELGHLPQRSVAWGLRDDIPLSDPFLAQQLASRYGLNHHFIPYDTDAFIKNSDEWTFLTELSTDNFGWYGEGTSVLLNEYTGNADFVLAGDENWGFGGHVRNRIEAMATCHMPKPTPDSVLRCLTPALAKTCSERYSGEVTKVMASCNNQDTADRRDFLYIHGRVARFIFSLGYYKELAVEVRRPFLNSQVLDVMQKIPVRFRYGKNLYISMLIRFFPELLKVSKRSADSLPNWRRAMHEESELSRHFSGLLSSGTISATSIAEHLDPREIERMRDNFFSNHQDYSVQGTDRSARFGPVLQSLKQRVTAYDDVRRALRLKKPPVRKLNNFDLLRRIALLVILDRNLPAFSDARSANGRKHA